MGYVFHGWRRKVGCALLVMALVSLGGWIRCFYYVDWAIIRLGHAPYLVRSDRGGISCNRWDNPRDRVGPLMSYGSHQAVTITMLGPELHDNFFVYYSGVAFPLTLLSAFLILWKPPKPAEKPDFAPK